jgi:hypothetical protein
MITQKAKTTPYTKEENLSHCSTKHCEITLHVQIKKGPSTSLIHTPTRTQLASPCSSSAQDVIEIMREALYDKFGGLDDMDVGCTDYRRAGA